MKNGKYQQADNNYLKRAKFRTKSTNSILKMSEGTVNLRTDEWKLSKLKNRAKKKKNLNKN